MANIINGTDTGSGGLITTGDSSDELQLQTAEVARVTLTNTAVVVNESGADVDFRVEGDTDANLLFVDASTDRVGVKTNAPSSDLHINPAADGIFTNGLRVQRATATTQNVVLNYSGGAANIVATDAALSNPIIRFFTSTDGTTATERMRITSAGAVEIANGNLVFSTNGTGIDFSASAGGGATSSILDDYEEGTFTPTAYGSTITGTTTYGDRSGRYTKIGRQVTAVVYLTVTNMTGTGVLIIDGLPFTSGDASYVGSIMTYNLDWPNAGSCVFYVGDSRTFAYIYISQDNGVWNIPNVDTSFTIIANITYFTS